MTSMTWTTPSLTKSGLGVFSAICFAAFAFSSESKTSSEYPWPPPGRIKYPAMRPGACLILGMMSLRRVCCASSSFPDSMLTPTATAYTVHSSPPWNGGAILEETARLDLTPQQHEWVLLAHERPAPARPNLRWRGGGGCSVDCFSIGV